MRIGQSVLIAFAAACAAVTSASLEAQATRGAAALILAEGAVSVNNAALAESSVPSLLPDSGVVQTAGGRAVVALKRGGWVLLNANSSVRVVGNGVYNFNRVEVLSGSAIVASDTSSPVVACESDIRLSSAGTFRFDVKPINATGGRPCEFRVFEGAAAVPLTSVTNALRAGQSMTCDRQCGDMIPTREFPPDELDDFDTWARHVLKQLKSR